MIPPPPNDAFAAARAIAALPYSDVVTMLASTVEQDEPAPAGSPFVGSAWWTFTASESERLQVDRAGCCGNALIHVYTGTALGSLDEVSVARGSFGRLIFQAVAGTTYQLQLGHDGSLYGGGLLGVSIQNAPIPSTAIFWSPFDPSSYDAVQFSGHAFDPAGFPIESWSWTFGDGGSAEGSAPSHRYFADGDYEVTMTVTTSDGRSASSRTTVSIRTHDVGISKLVVPTSAAPGKTKTITVEVVSAFAVETVRVDLSRSSPGGFVPVGASTQLVAKAGKATAFRFSYTFTPDDAAVGKVTFKALATIPGARDALTGDNEVISLPTKVG